MSIVELKEKKVQMINHLKISEDEKGETSFSIDESKPYFVLENLPNHLGFMANDLLANMVRISRAADDVESIKEKKDIYKKLDSVYDEMVKLGVKECFNCDIDNLHWPVKTFLSEEIIKHARLSPDEIKK